MKTIDEIISEYLTERDFGQSVTIDRIKRAMEEYAMHQAIEFIKWHSEQDNQTTFYLTLEEQYDFFLTEPARTTQKEQSIIANVSNSVCGIPNCQKEVHRLGYCEKHYKLFMKYPAY